MPFPIEVLDTAHVTLPDLTRSRACTTRTNGRAQIHQAHTLATSVPRESNDRQCLFRLTRRPATSLKRSQNHQRPPKATETCPNESCTNRRQGHEFGPSRDLTGRAWRRRAIRGIAHALKQLTCDENSGCRSGRRRRLVSSSVVSACMNEEDVTANNERRGPTSKTRASSLCIGRRNQRRKQLPISGRATLCPALTRLRPTPIRARRFTSAQAEAVAIGRVG